MKADHFRICDLVDLLASATTLADLESRTVKHLNSAFDVDRACINKLDQRGVPRDYSGAGKGMDRVTENLPALQALMRMHPVLGQFPPGANIDQSWRISDCVSRQEFLSSRIYNEYFLAMETMDQCGHQLEWTPNGSSHLVVTRCSGFFSDGFRESFQSAVKVVCSFYTNMKERERLAMRVESLQNVLSERDMEVIVFSPSGEILELSQSVRELIEDAWQVSAHEWVEQFRLKVVGTSIGSITSACDSIELSAIRPVRVEPVACKQGNVTAILFFKANLETTPVCGLMRDLSKRETEVTRWIAEGKSNGEIAMILGISVRTVEKHCENIYSKLGVESRLAVARQWLRGL